MSLYQKIINIKINNEIYAVHEQILKYCYYFESIMKGNFIEKEININFEFKIDFSIIIDILYKYHCSSIYGITLPFIFLIDFFNQ